MTEHEEEQHPRQTQKTSGDRRWLELWTRHRRAMRITVLGLALVLFLIWLPSAAVQGILNSLVTVWYLVLLSLLFLFVMLSLLWAGGQNLDARLFLFFNQRAYHLPWLDRLMFAITQLGNGMFATLTAIGLFFFGNQRLAIEILLGIWTLWMFVELIKAITDRGRPYLSLEEARLVGWGALGRSFPSGHTAQSFFMAVLLTHHFQAGLIITVLAYLVAALVGFTRIFIGVHYPRDVLAGAMLGAVWGFLGAIVNTFYGMQ